MQRNETKNIHLVSYFSKIVLFGKIVLIGKKSVLI